MLQESPLHAYISAKDRSRAQVLRKDPGPQAQVDDIEREVAELKKRGVEFEEYDLPDMKTKDGIATAGGAKAAWFKDTEGNTLALVQSLD
jgi:hypothetical protein